MEELSRQAAQRAASLIGVGVRSGAVVLGLSAVRRTRDLALVVVDASLSANTRAELSRLDRHGVRLFRCDALDALTAPAGRQDVSVLAVRAGPMAEGILARFGAGEPTSRSLPEEG